MNENPDTANRVESGVCPHLTPLAGGLGRTPLDYCVGDLMAFSPDNESNPRFARGMCSGTDRARVYCQLDSLDSQFFTNCPIRWDGPDGVYDFMEPGRGNDA